MKFSQNFSKFLKIKNWIFSSDYCQIQFFPSELPDPCQKAGDIRQIGQWTGRLRIRVRKRRTSRIEDCRTLVENQTRIDGYGQYKKLKFQILKKKNFFLKLPNFFFKFKKNKIEKKIFRIKKIFSSLLLHTFNFSYQNPFFFNHYFNHFSGRSRCWTRCRRHAVPLRIHLKNRLIHRFVPNIYLENDDMINCDYFWAMIGFCLNFFLKKKFIKLW